MSLSWWYHLTISSSVVPFSCLQSFLAWGSFQMSRLFTSGGQSIGASASASVLPMNIQDWFLSELTGLMLFAVQETLKSLLQHHSSKTSILWHSAFFMVQFSHPLMTTGTILLTMNNTVDKEILYSLRLHHLMTLNLLEKSLKKNWCIILWKIIVRTQASFNYKQPHQANNTAIIFKLKLIWKLLE